MFKSLINATGAQSSQHLTQYILHGKAAGRTIGNLMRVGDEAIGVYITVSFSDRFDFKISQNCFSHYSLQSRAVACGYALRCRRRWLPRRALWRPPLWKRLHNWVMSMAKRMRKSSTLLRRSSSTSTTATHVTWHRHSLCADRVRRRPHFMLMILWKTALRTS